MASTMQLEFAQAMSDFKTMFPDMDRDVIEAVLRANQGAVDATIDQLLAMSTDNQNEKLRNELDDKPHGTVNNSSRKSSFNVGGHADDRHHTNISLSTSPKFATFGNQSTGASPKVKKTQPNNDPTVIGGVISPFRTTLNRSSDLIDISSTNPHKKRWEPPLLGPLPANFLRLSTTDVRTEFDIPDEQFALMLQNEEFMNELRWNQEFMTALEKDQQEKGRAEDDMVFKERLRHMGKKSRKKFLQLARIFTWQRNKKPGAVRHPDSLLLQEEHSDDDEPTKRVMKK